MREENRTNSELSTADVAAAGERTAERAPGRAGREHDERVVERSVAEEVDVAGSRPQPLLPRDAVVELHERWVDVQASFVDEPRSAVEKADALVADAIRRLAQSFADERANLEGQWDRGGDVSTEDLRQSLQRYRSFFSRLLSV